MPFSTVRTTREIIGEDQYHIITLNCDICNRPVARPKLPYLVKTSTDIVQCEDFLALNSQEPSEWHKYGMIICRQCFKRRTKQLREAHCNSLTCKIRRLLHRVTWRLRHT